MQNLLISNNNVHISKISTKYAKPTFGIQWNNVVVGLLIIITACVFLLSQH
ncbi:hypothetical protein OTSSIDO_0727 [Orientia tsutsugamushi str. Sido]|nr:hypothetical protein OTSSIDO_0727 [Orientia tsutsugamushi str. Sido]